MIAIIAFLAAVVSGPVPFRDCAECPEMIVIPAGSFVMGSSADEQSWAVTHGATAASVSDEAPQHTVTVQSFALGKYDVTRAEYAAFVRETGYAAPGDCLESSMPQAAVRNGATWRQPGREPADRDPVTCVNWNDANAYIAWLNKKSRTSGTYRLPTEAEWEYAARGGTRTPFWWGDDDAQATQNAWYKDNADGHAHPVGLKRPNAFGLYDIAGNVWQWTTDCYSETYDTAPQDPAHCMRVDRGGSWLYPAWLLRSATRERNPPYIRAVVMGFRVAKR